MILSDADILRRLEAGDLVVEPLEDPDIQVQPASVDLRLGREFLEFQHANIPCIHPNSEQEVADYVSETVVPEDGEYILHPGDFVLGTTKERVRIPDDLIAHVEGRSSLGRLAIVVHASLPYDEQVFLWTPEDGFGFHDIGEVVENRREARAVGFDPNTLRVSTHRVTNYITNPTQRIYRVRLETGREVLVTRDHNLFTLDAHGGVTRIASEDAEGALVMVPDTLPPSPTTQEEIDLLDVVDPENTTLYASDGVGSVAWSRVPDGFRRRHESRDAAPMAAVPRGDTPDAVEVASTKDEPYLPRRLQLTPEFGWVLGFYIVEGSDRRDHIHVGAVDEEYLDRFAEFFRPYGTSLSWSDEEHTDELTVRSALWSRLFRELVGDGDRKNIPDAGWNWPDEVLEALLHGLLDGGGRRQGTQTTLHTEDPDLANRAAYLGTRLGYRTSISGRQRETQDQTSGGKTAGEEWAVEFQADTHEQEQEVPVPNELLRDYREAADMSLREAAAAMGDTSTSRLANVEGARSAWINRDTLARLNETYADSGVDTSRLDQLLDAGVRFERVAAVEETDRVEPTYDLEVQPNGRLIENFLGGRGGVFLSNTAGLCDPGYEGQITLELSNLGRAPVALTPGMRISQLTFTELKTPAERPYGEERGSKYQGQSGPQASRIQGDREFGGEQ